MTIIFINIIIRIFTIEICAQDIFSYGTVHLYSTQVLGEQWEGDPGHTCSGEQHIGFREVGLV